MASILLRMEEGEREAIRAAALKAGVKMAPWALGELLKVARGGVALTAEVAPRLAVARKALELAEKRVTTPERPIGTPAPRGPYKRKEERAPSKPSKGLPVHGSRCQCIACRSSR